jgi:signal transduction histidine kinase
MTQLVDDLLDVARITQGRIQFTKRPVDIAAVIAQTVQTRLMRCVGSGRSGPHSRRTSGVHE